MKRLAVVLIAVAWSQSAAADPPGKSPTVDLVRSVPMTVAVSSTVANPLYSPYDLVDGDLTTAWNSRTGDTKAWLAFRVPPGVHVDRVRMTVGFTAKGAEGDYFTMNPRISKVRVSHAGTVLREVALDPASRDLQDVPIDATGGDFKLEVIATVPGSKKAWREICVSELQVLGQRAPGSKAFEQLDVTVGSLDGPNAPDLSLELGALDTYASLDAYCAKAKAAKEEPCDTAWESCRKPPAAPACALAAPADAAPPLPATRPAGWKSARWVITAEGQRVRTDCHLAIEAGGKLGVLEHLGEGCGVPQGFDGKTDARFEVSMHGDWLVLVTATMGERNESGSHRLIQEQLTVCGTTRDGVPGCIDPIQIGELDHVEESGGEPGADGLDVHDEVDWRFRYELAGDVLTIAPDGGKADADQRKVLGKHRLRR